MESSITTVARINDVSIQIIENGDKRVPIRPICQALGIDYKTQYDKVKSDEILSSVVGLSPTTGADGKQYEMITIPLKYVFGWLFRIDSRNVKEEARESVLKYQMLCYDALYGYFAQMEEFLEWRQRIVEQQLVIYDKARVEFRDAKEKVQEARDRLNEARKITFNDYFSDKNQLTLEFDEPGKEASDAGE